MRLLLIICLFCYQIAIAQTADLLEWNEYYEIGWHDFQGKPTEESIGDAGTYVRIMAKPFIIKDQVHYDVTSYFVKNKSWVKDQSPQLLRHEQLHFDIAELYARKIRKKINDLQRKGVNDLNVYNTAIRKLLEESNEADLDYDVETLHGALQRKQQQWEENIVRQLEALSAYKKRKRVLSGK